MATVFQSLFKQKAGFGALKALVFLACLPSLAFGDDERIGTVKTYNPEAAVLRKGAEIKVDLGMGIQRGDVISTQGDGTVGVIFIDGAVLSLGPETKFVIDDFVFKPAEREVSFLSSLAHGTASFISGAIGRIAPESVKFKTPTATLGLRGTKILVEVR